MYTSTNKPKMKLKLCKSAKKTAKAPPEFLRIYSKVNYNYVSKHFKAKNFSNPS